MRETLPMNRMSMQTDLQNTRELRLWLLSAATHQGVTFYRIAGRFTSSGQTWEVSHRYSEFLTLRDQLVKFLSCSTDKCPGCRNYLHSLQRFDFPKKHLFASRAPMVVNYRVKALRSFVNLLASWAFSETPKCPICGGFAFDVVRNFVLEGDDVSPAADMNSIRESVRVEAFARQSLSTRGTYSRKNSWMRAEPDMTQSMHIIPSFETVHERKAPIERKAQKSEHQQDDDPYGAFNDYLPEKQSKVKKTTQASMEKFQSGKFSSRPLQETIEERHRRKEKEAEDENEYAQKLRKHRSEPVNTATARTLAESELSVGTSPHSRKRDASSASDGSMAAEPIFADDERKTRRSAVSSNSVYSGDEELELTGVTMASSPRGKSSAENLWQPWELARGA